MWARYIGEHAIAYINKENVACHLMHLGMMKTFAIHLMKHEVYMHWWNLGMLRQIKNNESSNVIIAIVYHMHFLTPWNLFILIDICIMIFLFITFFFIKSTTTYISIYAIGAWLLTYPHQHHQNMCTKQHNRCILRWRKSGM